MKVEMKFFTWLLENYISIFIVLTALSGAFVGFAKLTKNKQDDKWAAYFVKALASLKNIVTQITTKKKKP